MTGAATSPRRAGRRSSIRPRDSSPRGTTSRRPPGTTPATGPCGARFQRSRQLMNMLRGHRRFSPTTLWHMARTVGELDLRATLGLQAVPDRAPLAFPTLADRARPPWPRWPAGTAPPSTPPDAQRTSAGRPDRKVGQPWLRDPVGVVLERSRTWSPPPCLDPYWATRIRRRRFSPTRARRRRRARNSSSSTTTTRSSTTSCPVTRTGLDIWEAEHRSRSPGGRSIRRSLSCARAQGPAPSQWHAPMPMIHFQALDVSGVPSIPWENRGTWGQAIELPRAG